MSFFNNKNAVDAASKKRNGGKAAAGMAAAAVAVGGAAIATEAGAQAVANTSVNALLRKEGKRLGIDRNSLQQYLSTLDAAQKKIYHRFCSR